MLIAWVVSLLVACTFVSAPRASDLSITDSQIGRAADIAATAFQFPMQRLRFEFVANSETTRTRQLVALGAELAEEREKVRRWKRTTVLSIVYLSVGPVLWILGAATTGALGPHPAFVGPLVLGVGVTIIGGVFLPLSILLARKSQQRIQEIEDEIELDELGYEFGARELPLPAPGIVVPLLALRF
jgi:hypothetical protein